MFHVYKTPNPLIKNALNTTSDYNLKTFILNWKRVKLELLLKTKV
jgi:hypothetical protein